MSVNNLQQGTHIFKIKAVDEFDNWGQISSHQIKVDSIAPGVTKITTNGVQDDEHAYG